jgi:hypothetical protein
MPLLAARLTRGTRCRHTQPEALVAGSTPAARRSVASGHAAARARVVRHAAVLPGRVPRPREAQLRLMALGAETVPLRRGGRQGHAPPRMSRKDRRTPSSAAPATCLHAPSVAVPGAACIAPRIVPLLPHGASPRGSPRAPQLPVVLTMLECALAFAPTTSSPPPCAMNPALPWGVGAAGRSTRPAV